MRDFGGYWLSDWVFDATSGALIGGRQGGDTPAQPCRTYVTIVGAELDCPDAVECELCNDSEPRLAGCE